MREPAVVLIAGAGGRLGKALTRAAWPAVLRPAPVTRAQLDMDDERSVAASLAAHTPAVVINAAGFTDVDGAEREPESARRGNVEGPARLALACANAGARMIHVSTDYVFDGELDRPYAESDAPNPLGVYGRSKLEGEAAVMAACPGAVVVRTSWLIGPDRPNFLTAILARAESGEAPGVTDDQFGSPTTTDDLAAALIAVAARLAADPAAPGGLYHFASVGEASWKQVAEAILAAREGAGGPAAPPVSGRFADRGPGRARRPRRSALASVAIARDYGVTARPWREAAREVVVGMVERGEA